MMPEVGQRLGPYEILGKLGGGGMGVVFRAWDERLHREVAIKLLHEATYAIAGMRERFLQEARAASALNHPNICTIFDIGKQGEVPYLVMELLQGQTLKERIAHGALSVEEIIRFAEEVSEALAVAHAKEIVHRDIKPANIFLIDTPNGRSQAKVLDFGLAKMGLSRRGPGMVRPFELTSVGVTVGTVAYMSPEQARGEALDARSDLFSLGIVMYEMATRRIPFTGATSALVYVELLNSTPESVRLWNDAIPKELERVIDKLLTKDRNRRFQSANEVYAALQKIGNKGNGTWLRKLTPAAVPLVRAEDPVARQNRPKRPPSGVFAAQTGMADRAEPRGQPESNGTLIRPVARLPRNEISQAPQRLMSGIALESGARPAAEQEPGIVDSAPAERTDVAKVNMPPGELPAEARTPMRQRVHPAAAKPDEVPRATEEPALKRSDRGRILRRATAGVLALAVASVIYLLIRAGGIQPPMLRPNEAVLITPLQNKTGDASLDGSLAEALEIGLRQSPSLRVMGVASWTAGLTQLLADAASGDKRPSGRIMAQKLGAKIYLYGEVRGTEAPYTISVDVLNAETNDKLGSVSVAVEDKQQMVSGVGELAERLRERFGEQRVEIERSSVPLERDASANLDALEEYAKGERALFEGHDTTAVKSFQAAAATDPRFALAHIALASLYAARGAEVEAAGEATKGRSLTAEGSSRIKLLADYEYELDAKGNYDRSTVIAKQLSTKYPNDSEGKSRLSRVLLRAGRHAEALQAAEEAISLDFYDAAAHRSEEVALSTLDRPDSALQAEAKARQAGLAPSGMLLTAAFLAGKSEIEQQESLSWSTSEAMAAGWSRGREEYALFLDNTGKLAMGREVWLRDTELEDAPSARASRLTIGAMDRAIAGECAEADSMLNGLKSMKTAMWATYRAAMAKALCGDGAAADAAVEALRRDYPESTAVAETLVPNLQAAGALAGKSPEQAMAVLTGVPSSEQAPLTSYLRGLARLDLRDGPAAAADFNSILAHRGAALVSGSNVYAMAQIGVARAYALSGDKLASADGYRRFLDLWADADGRWAALSEAKAKSR